MEEFSELVNQQDSQLVAILPIELKGRTKVQKLRVIHKKQDEIFLASMVSPALRKLPEIGRCNTIADILLLSIFVASVAALVLLIGGVSLIQTSMIAFGFLFLTVSILQVVDFARARTTDCISTNVADTDVMQRGRHDIWCVYASRGGGSKPDRVALVSTDLEQSRMIGAELADRGHEVHHSTNREAMLECVQCQSTEWSMVIFDLDAAPDLETGIDELIDFRAVCSDVPVLLMSGGALYDEFSCHRRLIGDATLRKPIYRAGLIEGVEIAHLNSNSGLK